MLDVRQQLARPLEREDHMDDYNCRLGR
jgi:hypothetical protein